MAKISDEIRKWCGICRDSCIDGDDCNELRALADRIDAELVELPKDRDGVPIHVDDRVWDARGGNELFVNGINMEGGGIGIRVYEDGVMWDVIPHNLTHTRPDSFERIADELDAWCDRPASYKEHKEFHTFADRIRKLAEKEGK